MRMEIERNGAALLRRFFAGEHEALPSEYFFSSPFFALCHLGFGFLCSEVRISFYRKI
jgi:hypothetical protein